MATHTVPAITRLIDHVGSPTELARRLSEHRATPLPPQNVFAWRKRGWASPMHILELEPWMPPGMTIRELHEDRLIAQGLPLTKVPAMQVRRARRA